MKKDKDILLRVKELIKSSGLNQSQFAAQASMRQNNLSEILSGKRPLGDNIINKLIISFGINKNWLLEGSGEMIALKKVPTEAYKTEFKPETRPRIPYAASAGSLTSSVEGVTEIQCEQIPLITAFPTYDFTILIKGDSMYPNYEGGDEVACKRIDSTSFIQWGKVHVLDTAQGILIKRVYEDGEDVRCVSYNKEYPDFTVAKSEVYSMSLIVGLLRL